MTRWKSIETAPKDGTKILAYCPKNNYGKPVFSVTWWRKKEDHATYIGWGEFNKNWPPTHWMPLPYPPNVSEIEVPTPVEILGRMTID